MTDGYCNDHVEPPDVMRWTWRRCVPSGFSSLSVLVVVGCSVVSAFVLSAFVLSAFVLSAFNLTCPLDWTVDVQRNNQVQEPWPQLLVDGDAGLLPDSDANTLIIIRLATIRDTWLAVHNWSCSQRNRSEYVSGGGLIDLLYKESQEPGANPSRRLRFFF